MLVLSIFGAYSLGNNTTDVVVMLALGVLYYFAGELGFPPVATVLGLILGSYAETGFLLTRRIGLAHGSVFKAFFASPISLIMVGLIIVSLIPTIVAMLKQRSETKLETQSPKPSVKAPMYRWNIISGGVLLLLSAALFLYANTLELEARIFPEFVLGIMSICALALLLQNLPRKSKRDLKPVFLDFGLKQIGVIFIILLSGYLFSFLGYFFSLFIAMAVMPFLKYWRQEKADPQKLKLWLPVAFVFTVIMFLIFHVALGVPTPEGLFL